VRNLTEVTQVAVGQHHSCALRANGTVWCWGDYIPLGTPADQLTPLRVPGLTGVAQISSAPTGTGTCAVRRVGTVWCWGNNDALQWYRLTPVRLAGLSGVVQLGTGYHHQCARLSTGAVRCWGYNDYGQLGNGTVIDSATPVAVTGLAGRVTQLDVSGWHSCVRKADASVWCWGWNAAGQIGDGSTTDRLVPTKSLMTNATSTQLGDYHTCARTKANRAKCWGGNGYGQLGNGSTVARPTPVAVVGLTGVKAVIAGREHTCAVLADTTMRCWGYNEDGQLGNGTTASSTFPTPVLT
jgi:alpha-tubulin suppressor-like RCC1 family protein